MSDLTKRYNLGCLNMADYNKSCILASSQYLSHMRLKADLLWNGTILELGIMDYYYFILFGLELSSRFLLTIL